MTNFTIDNKSDSTVAANLTLIDILDALGFIQVDVMIYQFVIPIVGCVGSVFAAISVIIFFNSKYNTPIFVYFRVLSLIYLLLLMACVTYGFCFTPQFFPSMESQWCAYYQLVYLPFSGWVFFYATCIEMGILLERLKIFRPILKRYCSLTPRVYCLACFVGSVLETGFFVLLFKPSDGDTYYYFDKRGAFRQNKFYYVTTSDFAASPRGQIVFFVGLVVGQFIPMIVSVSLNTALLVHMKRYLHKKAKKFKLNSSIAHVVSRSDHSHILSHTGNSNNTVVASAGASTNEERASASEKNFTLMILSLCFISISLRSIIILCDVYYLFTTNYVATLIGSITDMYVVMSMAASFLVFYNFNNIFRDEFWAMFAKMSRLFKKV